MIVPKRSGQSASSQWPYNVINPTAVPLDATITLTWGDPIPDTGAVPWAGTRVMCKIGSYPSHATDGRIVVDSTVHDQYSVTGYVDNGPTGGFTDGAQVYYWLVPYAEDGSYSWDVDNRIPMKTIQYIYPSNMVAASVTPGNEQLAYTYTLPANATSCRIVYKTGSYPANINDGTVIEPATSGGVITGLTNDTTYYLVFVPKNSYGRYKFDVTANGRTGVPMERFTFTYTGDCDEEEVAYSDGMYYQIKLLTSGTFTSLSNQNVDVFAVGGGGGATSGGGGGGYTTTRLSLSLVVGTPTACVIGAGSIGVNYRTNASSGGSTTFGQIAANGGGGGAGSANALTRNGGNGGSGGGGGGSSAVPQGGDGGSNGSNGTTASSAGGTGQGSTTRAFADALGKLYGGGGGGASNGAQVGGAGGANGGGTGGGYPTPNPTDGQQNTGGGGGGGWQGEASHNNGSGGSGIVILRWPV